MANFSDYSRIFLILLHDQQLSVFFSFFFFSLHICSQKDQGESAKSLQALLHIWVFCSCNYVSDFFLHTCMPSRMYILHIYENA